MKKILYFLPYIALLYFTLFHSPYAWAISLQTWIGVISLFGLSVLLYGFFMWRKLSVVQSITAKVHLMAAIAIVSYIAFQAVTAYTNPCFHIWTQLLCQSPPFNL